jgi:hypothetical protein
MPRFLVEVPHDGSVVACKRAIQVFLTTGSHFLARAEWGCADGEHKAWMIVDVDTKEEARNVVPAAFREQAEVVKLTTYNLQDIQDATPDHRR